MNLTDMIGPVRDIALRAGEITLRYYNSGGYDKAVVKGDGSPVTKADREAEIFIEAALLKLWPGIPVIGEESVADGRRTDVSSLERFWLVDPLDGTKEFISGGGEYTVNIALIENGVPVLGVVYAPVGEDLYSAHGYGTAMRKVGESAATSIKVRPVPLKGLTVMASKSHGDAGRLARFLGSYTVEKFIRRGSSLKVCSIAAGEADMYPRFGLTCEWDTAAAHAVLSAAGGILAHADTGAELTYGHNREGKWLNPEFIASGFTL